ncbi:Hsp70 family protein [bacterium]|nr:Hsp70 family protein [bacterium]
MGIKLGLDFGTSNIVVSTILPGEGDEISVFDCWNDSYLLPSYVCLEDKDNPIVGGIAKENWESGNKHCYRSFNLDIGRCSESYAQSYPAGITPELLTQYLIEHIKKTLLGNRQSTVEIGDIDEVVVSVPYCWSDDQQEAIKKTFTDAGSKVKSLVSEPIAAAAYYSYLHKKGDQVVLVCNIGDNTFDISLVRVLEKRKIEVIDSKSCEQAGMWADALIAKEFADEFNKRYGFKITADAQELLRMTDDADIMVFLREANRVKEFLNNKRVAMLNNKRASVRKRKLLPAIVPLAYKHITLELQFGSERLEETLTPIVEAGKSMIQALLNTNSDNPPDSVVMVGGMGKMQLQQEMVT